MSRTIWKSGTFIYPLPVVMVSCGDMEKSNIITVAWTGILNTNPAMVYISVRPERYSYNLIKEKKEFVINLTTEKLAKQTDWCGVKSGKNVNKFKEMNLTAIKAPNVNAPMIDESPLCIECRVVEIKELGSHDMFIANVVGVHADEKYINKESGLFDLQSAKLMTYSHGKYYSIGEQLGFFGFSVQKKKK